MKGSKEPTAVARPPAPGGGEAGGAASVEGLRRALAELGVSDGKLHAVLGGEVRRGGGAVGLRGEL